MNNFAQLKTLCAIQLHYQAKSTQWCNGGIAVMDGTNYMQLVFDSVHREEFMSPIAKLIKRL